MCGIVGIVDTGRAIGPQRLREAVAAMRDCLTHRGPDDSGVWIDPTGLCALGHRRLSILDLSEFGHQPMVDTTGQNAIVFNGEIYNFQELATTLRTQGHEFKSNCDTEVLLTLLADQRPMHLLDLRGMFSLAVWNSAKRRLMLARDPFGKKPLYFGFGKGFFAFASELRALEMLDDLDLTIDPDAIGEYLLLQYVHAPRSIYRGVSKLQPGCVGVVSPDSNTIRTDSYWQFDTGSTTPNIPLGETFNDRVDQLGHLVETAVQRRLVSDVPLGAFLSGGVDSALVVAMMKKLGARTRTYSLGFEDSDDTEHIYAREIAEHLDTEHEEIILRPDAIELAPAIADALDEPNGDSSCLPTWLLSEFTRRHVTVALSGDGGDEMFGGYGRYFDTLAEFTDSAPSQSPAEAYLGPRWTIFQPEHIEDFLGKTPPAVNALIDRWSRLLDDPQRPLIHRMRSVDAESYLPGAVLAKVDRMSMQYSLEVRCPLLDSEIGEFAAALSAEDCVWRDSETRRFHGKRILKELLLRHLPAEWVHRKKSGFGLPAGFWNPQGLRNFATDLLDSRSTELRSHMKRKGLRRWLQSQHDPQHFSIYRLWPMLILELWLRKPRPKRIKV